MNTYEELKAYAVEYYNADKYSSCHYFPHYCQEWDAGKQIRQKAFDLVIDGTIQTRRVFDIYVQKEFKAHVLGYSINTMMNTVIAPETPRRSERLAVDSAVQYNAENPRRSARLAAKPRVETPSRSELIDDDGSDSDVTGYDSDVTEYCLTYNAIWERNRSASKKQIRRMVVTAVKDDTWWDLAYERGIPGLGLFW